MVGSAVGPTNPFQAAIALRLAQLPPLSSGGLRLVMFVAGVAVWMAWTMRYAVRTRDVRSVRLRTDEVSHAKGIVEPGADSTPRSGATQIPGTMAMRTDRKHALIMVIVLAPMAAYVYGALRLDWGLNELSGGFLAAGVAAGLVGRLGFAGTVEAYLQGMQSLLPAALVIGAARSISLVL